MTKLFKLQRPLAGDMSYCIAYDESRKTAVQVPFDKTAQAFFKQHGNPMKLYVHARISRLDNFYIESVPVKQDYNW